MELGDRIRLKRLAVDKTLEDVAKIVGVSRQTLSRYENGIISNIPSDKIELLAKALQTTPGYLMGWETEPGFDPFDIPGIERPKWQRVPLLGEIACGEPILAEENIEEYVSVSAGVNCDFVLRCKGDSMAPRLLDGDLVMIRQQPDVCDGQIAAVLIDNEATLKHLYHLPNRSGVQLLGDNSAYAPKLYVGEAAKEVRVLGRAVAYQRRLG